MAGKKAEAAKLEEAQAAQVPPGTVTQEAYVLMAAKLKSITAAWTAGVCYGTNMTIDGKKASGGHTSCHSWIGPSTVTKSGGSYYTTDWTEEFVVLTCHKLDIKVRTCSEEAHQEIIRWMVSDRSPFARFCLNRSDPDSLKDGLIILCGGPNGAGKNVCLWMCKVLRYAVEGSKALDTWLTLYKGGVNPLLAIMVATQISSVKGATFGAAAVMSHCNVFYNNFDSGDRRANPVRLLKGDFDNKADKTSSVFGKDGHSTKWETKIDSFVKPYKKSDGWGGFIEGQGVEGEDLIKLVKEWEAELSEGQTIPARFPVHAGPVAPSKPKVPRPTKTTVYLEGDL